MSDHAAFQLGILERIVRSIHHYGDPPDPRLQERVDRDVQWVTDTARAYAAAFAHESRAASLGAPGPAEPSGAWLAYQCGYFAGAANFKSGAATTDGEIKDTARVIANELYPPMPSSLSRETVERVARETVSHLARLVIHPQQADAVRRWGDIAVDHVVAALTEKGDGSPGSLGG